MVHYLRDCANLFCQSAFTGLVWLCLLVINPKCLLIHSCLFSVGSLSCSPFYVPAYIFLTILLSCAYGAFQPSVIFKFHLRVSFCVLVM